MPVNEHLNLGTVMFSTPVSSQKISRGGLIKLKSTRFTLPNSSNESHDSVKNSSAEDSAQLRYMKISVSSFCFLSLKKI